MRTALAAAAAILAIAAARPAAADPVDTRVLSAPTAWLPEAGVAVATLGVDHRGQATAIAGYGLGSIAELELGSDTDVRACRACGDPDHGPEAIALGRAAFRLGAAQDAWLPGMPALVLGVRATFAARGHAVHDPRASDAYLIASRDLGIVRIHAGADAISAQVGDLRAAARLRPLAGLEIRPPIYPRSSLLGDIAWEPALDAARRPTLGWLLGLGVRYQAFAWANVELAVRAREGDGLGASTVMLRLNAVLARHTERRSPPARGPGQVTPPSRLPP